MKDWEECRKNDVKQRSKNPEQAKSLLRMAKIRIKDNKRRKRNEENVPLIIETYWESIKQMITALLKLEGYKSYSQECLITYVEEHHKISRDKIELMNQLRKLRNEIDYDGEFLDVEYLERNEKKMEEIIEELESVVEEKLN